MLLEISLAAVVIMAVSLSGVIFTHGFAKRFLETRLSTLVSFSAGVFLVTSGALILEVFHIVESVPQAIALVVVGYAAAWALHFLLPETHHHHGVDCAKKHSGARKLIVGDAIHNLADGIILVPAFLVSPALGLAVTVSIIIHETLQEISEFFVLRQAGYTVRRALLVNALVSSTIFIGVGLSYFALATAALEGVLLAVAAGFFLHVVVHDLLPKRHEHETVSGLVAQLGFVFLGVTLMGMLTLALSDTHEHGAVDHDHELGHVDKHEADGEPVH